MSFKITYQTPTTCHLRSSVKVWDMVPAMRGIGYGQMIANASVISYYTCLIALAVYYLVGSRVPIH